MKTHKNTRRLTVTERVNAIKAKWSDAVPSSSDVWLDVHRAMQAAVREALDRRSRREAKRK
jgi:hypothetical protein